MNRKKIIKVVLISILSVVLLGTGCTGVERNPIGFSGINCEDGLLYMGTTDGNFSEKPRFCDTAIGDYHISNASYCVPERSGCGELVGALGVGCEVYDGPVWHVAVTGDDSTGNGSSELPFATIQTCSHFGQKIT